MLPTKGLSPGELLKKLSEHGAELAFTYVGDALKKRVIPLAESLGSTFTLDCNVENKEQIVKTFSDIKSKWGKHRFCYSRDRFF